MEWSKENTIKLIESYHAKTIIWDPQDPEHFNKIKRQDAWMEIATEAQITVDQCKKKMENLLASLRREKMKMKKSTGTGKGTQEVYKSNWFAFKSLQFILDKNKTKPSLDTASIIPKVENTQEDEWATDLVPEDPTQEDEWATDLVSEDFTQMETEVSEHSSTSDVYQEPSLCMTGKFTHNRDATRKRPSTLVEVKNCITKLQKIVADSTPEDENEFDYFCKSIAIQLKKMPLERALVTQEKILAVVREERLEQLKH